MMVEDDDDDDADRGLNGAPNGDVVELRSQVSQLEQKVDELEAQLRERSNELEKAQSSNQDRDSVSLY
jgi:TolA-binding protein